MIIEEIKETKNDEETTQEVEPETKPTKEELALNQKLLESSAKITKLEQEKRDLEMQAKEKSFNEILAKKNIKPEFHEFVKFKLQWQDISDLDKATDDFIKDNPALTKTITTGGNGDTEVKTNGEPETKENSLLQYKKENFL